MSGLKRRFKLTFNQLELAGVGGNQRGLIIAVANTGVTGWLQAVIAAEDGSMQQKMISVAEFEVAKRHQVCLVEVDNERGPSVIYTPEQLGR